ncbi:class I SAM-dependent methyltransferase [Limobrevibacterium gyesilva]|uniref:Class I SAM-dependent methyltransferase n=1 Tax=Limobrevibacterium gyesilva TaxID=2991712 RepID=A0AA41YT66_9PROT|nr:class I SAM-dependent methyltransferase [Limobrevibacterium gyesilva]MCW3476020.1 class I SAM-dependent methyltransferase [Limobrevibacterium gyesilva]
MTIEHDVAGHYAHGGLEQAILEALVGQGKDPDRLDPADLAPVDEFHIGGRQATADLAAQLALAPGRHLLDIGSGIGGAARYFALAHDCRVTGIDLTEEYVAVARSLARRTGLGGKVRFQQGSALDLPFPDASFDGAYMLHVGMNIADKPALFAGVRRVLRPGGFLAVYDVMRVGEGALDFPVPWASRPETSFVAAAPAYRAALRAAGFAVTAERDRRDFAIAFFGAMKARQAETGPPPLGLPILMGPDFRQKTANMIGNLERGLIAPTEMIARLDG